MEEEPVTRPLIIDEKLKERIAEIVAYAKDNPYIVGETIIPGDDPHYVLETGTGYRAVFSYTRMPDHLYRDLSISVKAKGKFPNPVAAFVLAQLFGFTGYDEGMKVPDDWMISKDIHFDAIRIVQQIE